MKTPLYVLLASFVCVTQAHSAVSESAPVSSAQTQPATAEDTTPMKSFNVQVAPVSMLVSRPNVSVDFGVTDTITIGPRIRHYTRDDRNNNSQWWDTRGNEFGLRANFFLGNTERYTTSWVMKPGLYYMNRTRDDTFIIWDERLVTKGLMAELLFAYHMAWSNGFNLELGGGLQGYREKVYSVSWNQEVRFERERTRAPLVLEANVGFAF